MSDIGWNVDRLDCVEGRLRTQVLSVRAIQLVERWCANGGPNRGTLLEARHRLPERHYAGTESDNPAHAPCQNLGQSEPLFWSFVSRPLLFYVKSTNVI